MLTLTGAPCSVCARRWLAHLSTGTVCLDCRNGTEALGGHGAGGPRVIHSIGDPPQRKKPTVDKPEHFRDE
jgi:hypothetical protein